MGFLFLVFMTKQSGSTGLVLSISLANQRVKVDKMNAMSKGLFGRLERDWQKAILNNRSQDARPAQQATKSKQWLNWKIERNLFLGSLINHFRVLFRFQYVSAGREGIFKRVSLPAGNIHSVRPQLRWATKVSEI